MTQALARAALLQFIAELRDQRRASPHTIKAYQRDWDDLFEITASPDLRYLTTKEIQKALMVLHGRGLGARSISRTLSGWRAWYQWLIERGLISKNPTETLRPPKPDHPLPATVSIDMVMSLFKTTPLRAIDRRDIAICELFYSSGIRLQELANLNWDAIDLEGEEIRVIGKGNKSRIVPIGAPCVAALRAWNEVRHEFAKPDELAVFVGQHGARLGMRSIEYRVRDWAKRCSLPLPLHPHMLRHSFASHILQSSQNLRAVQELLGHANLSTTQIYTHLDFQHLAHVYDAAHPRAHRKN